MYPKVLSNLDYEEEEKEPNKLKTNPFRVPLSALHISSFPAIGWDHIMLPSTPHTQKCLLRHVLRGM